MKFIIVLVICCFCSQFGFLCNANETQDASLDKSQSVSGEAKGQFNPLDIILKCWPDNM